MTTSLRIFAEYIHPDQEVVLEDSDGKPLERLTRAFDVKTVWISNGRNVIAREVDRKPPAEVDGAPV